jgi:hypothetical protein
MISFVDDHRAVYGVEPICRVLPIAPSSYHARVAQRADGFLLLTAPHPTKRVRGFFLPPDIPHTALPGNPRASRAPVGNAVHALDQGRRSDGRGRRQTWLE